jgi:hypothetical protein
MMLLLIVLRSIVLLMILAPIAAIAETVFVPARIDDEVRKLNLAAVSHANCQAAEKNTKCENECYSSTSSTTFSSGSCAFGSLESICPMELDTSDFTPNKVVLSRESGHTIV